VLSLLSLSCEKERSGIVDTPILPPFMRSASLNVSYLHIDTTTSGGVTRLPNGKFQITITLTARVSDPNGLQDVKQVFYRIYAPVANTYFLSGQLGHVADNANATEAAYAGDISFTIERSASGVYYIEMYAQGTTSLVSNSIQVSLHVAKNNSLPHLSNLSAPDTLIRPSTGYELLFFAVTVSDSDGLADIDRIFFRSLISSNPDFQQPMFDDGRVTVTGDSLAGDGRYSRLLALDSTATLGTKLFRFYALDKSGVIGDSLDHTMIVISE
jgi:hypothetical protein